MTSVFLETPKRLVDVEIDGVSVRVPEGATLLDACRAQGSDLASSLSYFVFGVPAVILGAFFFFLADWIVRLAYRNPPA